MGQYLSDAVSIMKFAVALFILFMFFDALHGYGSGGNLPAELVCEKMKPGPPHGTNLAIKQQNDPPFLVTADKKNKNVFLVNVRVDLDRFPDTRFKGLFLMAESKGQRGYGYFAPLKRSQDAIKTFACANLPILCDDPADCQGTANAIVHSTSNPKTNITALWVAPTSMTGSEVTFVATVMEKKETKG